MLTCPTKVLIMLRTTTLVKVYEVDMQHLQHCVVISIAKDSQFRLFYLLHPFIGF